MVVAGSGKSPFISPGSEFRSLRECIECDDIYKRNERSNLLADGGEDDFSRFAPGKFLLVARSPFVRVLSRHQFSESKRSQNLGVTTEGINLNLQSSKGKIV
jgi:hypothetical protein